jgi:hypothetical protein
MRPQILHQMVHRRLTSIVNKTVRKPRQPTHAANRDDLTAGLPRAFSTLVAFDEQFEESHGGGEDGGDVGLEGVGPELRRAVVEVIIADFLRRGFRGGFGTGVGRGVEGCLAGVVDEEVDVACFGGDLVDGALQVSVGGCAALDGG